MHPGFLFLGALLYTSCVLGLCLSAFFNDMTLFINKKKKKKMHPGIILASKQKEKKYKRRHTGHIMVGMPRNMICPWCLSTLMSTRKC